jgi:Right handed beta helix region
MVIDHGSPLVQQNTIKSNITDVCGGGSGGGILIAGSGSAEILDNAISDNVSLVGGGIDLSTDLSMPGTPIIKRNIIKGNNASGGQGGGIHMLISSDALIVQNLITGNQAFEGGGIHWFVNGGARGPILVNNTIADNNATNGSGIFAEGDDARTELTNNIIVAKPGQTGLYCSPIFGQHQPIIRNNNIFSAGGTAYGGSCSDMTGTGNISADPLFTNPTQGNYHLQLGSPSIDAGDNQAPNLPDKDLDGDPRILDGDHDGTAIVDMGVDEFRRAIRVPSDQPTIRAAITFAIDGEMVLVAPGTYVENINFEGKAIIVTSESGPEVTIIDGGNADPVVSFTSGEGRDSVLNGFTLQHGFNNQDGIFNEGGGIKVLESSPTITNNVIRNNQACNGGGIGIGFGSPLIRQNTITGNDAIICGITPGAGGGIRVNGASSIKGLDVEILDNVISDNVSGAGAGGGIALSGSGTKIVKRNIIKGNTSDAGGGIYIINDTNVPIVQNLITGNLADEGGGIWWGVANGARGPILVNNTIADNSATFMGRGSGIFAGGFDAGWELTNNIIVAKPGQTALICNNFGQTSPPIIRFNNIFSIGGTGCACGGSCVGNGNISADPLFTNPTQGDYHLRQGSPSIDSGDNLTPNLPDKDLDGNPRILDGDGNGTATIDMGVYEFLAPTSSVWNFTPRRPRSFTVKIPIGVGSPNTLSSISWAIPFKLDGRRIVKGSSLWDSYRR